MRLRRVYLRRSAGVTAIELLVALAVIGILSALAWPNYTEYAARGRRTRAQLDLTEAAQYLQRQYAAANTLDGAVLPAPLVQSPHDGAAAYLIGAQIGDGGRSFTLQAVPQAAYATDRCGTLALQSTGQRSNRADQPVRSCWR